MVRSTPMSGWKYCQAFAATCLHTRELTFGFDSIKPAGLGVGSTIDVIIEIGFQSETLP